MRNEILQHKTGRKCKHFRKNGSFSDKPHDNEDSFVQTCLGHWDAQPGDDQKLRPRAYVLARRPANHCLSPVPEFMP